MLEILAIISLCSAIGDRVRKKGHYKALRYQLAFVALWLGGEFCGAFLAAAFGIRGIMTYVGALVGAGVGTAIAFAIVAMLDDISPPKRDPFAQAFSPLFVPPTDDPPPDPSNPYASPRAKEVSRPPLSAPGDLLNWLDEASGKNEA